ncbi:M20/M25/M40 family metallo-hydrolase [Nocardioides rotundus]|nr:M20/M25/M40 family metallo-hydrolase [Nocardioides rotundus]
MVGTTTAVAAPPAQRGQDPAQASRKFREAVTLAGQMEHLNAFQRIADANDGNRASGTPGYRASMNYVIEKLRAAGYKPTVQTFEFPYFAETTPAQLSQVSPDATTYASPDDFSTMSFSGSGDVTAEVVAVDTDLSPSATSTSGCEAEDFASFPEGAIALMQRGTCPFGQKAANAEAAGASAALIFNRGTEGEEGSINGTLGEPVGIPVLGLSYPTGVDLGDPAGTTARVTTDTVNETRTTYNVLAETAKGDPSNVVMAGAHLDGIEDGPGINDNGSGSAGILEIAEQLAKEKKLANKVRFAWWGAEELGLLGAEHYVTQLQENDPAALDDIAAYLNFDMIGSPNFVRFVYDGDNSLGTGVDGPDGSGQIEQMFTRYFDSVGLASEETPFSGRSDYGPFLDAGVASGGLFSGADGVKTEEQAAIYGGTAGEIYDPNYHTPEDDITNISETSQDQLGDAAAHGIYTLAQSTALVNGEGKVRGPKTPREYVGPRAVR